MGEDEEVSCGVLSSGHDKAIAEMTHSSSGHSRKIKPVKKSPSWIEERYGDPTPS